MKRLCMTSLLLLMLAGCSQEAEPYQEVNTTILKQEKGHIQTH